MQEAGENTVFPLLWSLGKQGFKPSEVALGEEPTRPHFSPNLFVEVPLVSLGGFRGLFPYLPCSLVL